MGTRRAIIAGDPDYSHISTSYVERQNLTMRMSMRRFTGLTNGFSKKLENHEHAVAIYYMYYNFCRIHQTLRVTPSMEAGISDHVWSLDEVDCFIGLRTMEVEYMPGDVVPVTSALYRVVHEPAGRKDSWKRFTPETDFHSVQNVARKFVTCFLAEFSERKSQTEPLPNSYTIMINCSNLRFSVCGVSYTEVTNRGNDGCYYIR